MRAILYEEHYPFVDGLLPQSNYQNLLKLIVWDHLKRAGPPKVMPWEILVDHDSETLYKAVFTGLRVIWSPAQSPSGEMVAKSRVHTAYMVGDDIAAWFIYRLLELGFPYFETVNDALSAVLSDSNLPLPQERAEVTLEALGCLEQPRVRKAGKRMLDVLWADLVRARNLTSSVEARRDLLNF